MKQNFFVCLIFFSFILNIIHSQKKAVCVLSSTPNITGSVTFTQPADGQPVTVSVSVKGAKITYQNAFHIHEKPYDNTGNCSSTGAHFNPRNQTHGDRNSSVRHDGDLGNFLVDNKTNELSGTINDNVLTLYGNNSIIGKGCVVHEGIDDLGMGGNATSMTTGNSGGRLACGNVMEVNATSAGTLYVSYGLVLSALIAFLMI
jgi:Cu-Zn family superoxide dismutase